MCGQIILGTGAAWNNHNLQNSTAHHCAQTRMEHDANSNDLMTAWETVRSHVDRDQIPATHRS